MHSSRVIATQQRDAGSSSHAAHGVGRARIGRGHLWAFVTTLVASVGLAACGQASAASKPDATARPAAVDVETIPAAARPMPRVIRLSGSVVGLRVTSLAANANGRVLEASVDRGSEVKKGDILAKLDTRSAALGAAEAQATLTALDARQKQAEVDCDRAAQLYASGAISRADYDRSVLPCATSPAERQASVARLSIATLSVTDGTIRAPFEGYVTERRVHVGEYVRADTPIASLVDLDTLRLEVAVPEVYLASLRQGAEIRFTVPAFEQRTFTAKVRATAGTVRAATRDVIFDADVANPDHALLPGMFASIVVPLTPADAIAIPTSAIIEKNGNPRVFTLVDGRLEEHVVELGERDGDLVAVSHGLEPGDEVVRTATADLKNGAAAE